MNKIRVIARLDIKDEYVVKGELEILMNSQQDIIRMEQMKSYMLITLQVFMIEIVLMKSFIILLRTFLFLLP